MKEEGRNDHRVVLANLRRATIASVSLAVLLSTHTATSSALRKGLDREGPSLEASKKLPAPAQGEMAAAGFDFYENDPSMTQIVFKSDLLLPSGFFGPGSKKFKGTIPFIGIPVGSFMGQNTGTANMIVQRLQAASLPTPGSSATVPIEIISLSLVSAQPIPVRVGSSIQLWHVQLGLLPGLQPRGTMTIRKVNANGGTFSSELPVLPHFVFTRSDGPGVATLDPPMINLKIDQAPWVDTPPAGSLVLPGLNDEFFLSAPAVFEAKRVDIGIRPARPLVPGEVSPGAGVTIKQVDFTWPAATVRDSTTGQLDVDIATLRRRTGIQEGFLNAFTSLGWVVQNLPIFADYTYPTLSTKFQLGATNGTDIPVVDVFLVHVTTPLDHRATTNEPMTPFPVGDIQYNSQGKGPAVVAGENPPPPAPGTVRFTVGGVINECGQNGHTNVQAASNQCGPAAAANSLQWLEDTYALNVSHPHQPGVNGDGSLVGELDREMGRAPGNGVSDEKFLDGKLGYLANNNLGNRVTVRHQDDGAGGSLPGGGNFTRHGLTSTGNGSTTAAFILKEICDGEDVEVGFTRKSGSGHWVTAVKGATILGVPVLYYVSDSVQGDNTQGTNTVDCSYLLDSDGDGLPNLVNEAGAPNVDIVVAESPRNVEVDRFSSSVALVTVQMPAPVQLQLSGPTTINVFIAPDGTGASDTDGDGLDQVQTEMVELSLSGMSPLGPITVRRRDPSKHPNQRSTGEIEERVNTQAGRLDLSPFAQDGSAESFFDVFFEVEVAGQVLHSHQPKRMRSTITHKPPAEGETYFNPDVIPLFTESEQPAGVTISGASHTPRPRMQIPPISGGTDAFPLGGTITLSEDILPGTPVETINLRSSSDSIVQRQTQVGDTIDTEMLSLTLQGTSPLLGSFTLVAGRNLGLPPATGQIRNVKQNPDGSLMSGDSFFDITYRINFVNVPRFGPISALGNASMGFIAEGIHSLPPDKNPGDMCVSYIGFGPIVLMAGAQQIGVVNQMVLTPFAGVPGTACSGAGSSSMAINRNAALAPRRTSFQRRQPAR